MPVGSERRSTPKLSSDPRGLRQHERTATSERHARIAPPASGLLCQQRPDRVAAEHAPLVRAPARAERASFALVAHLSSLRAGYQAVQVSGCTPPVFPALLQSADCPRLVDPARHAALVALPRGRVANDGACRSSRFVPPDEEGHIAAAIARISSKVNLCSHHRRSAGVLLGVGVGWRQERHFLVSFTHREKGQSRTVMTALDDTLVEKVERLVDASGQPLRSTSSTTVVIAQLVERIESLEAAVREIADAVGAATEADHAATKLHSGDRLSTSIS